VETTSEPSNRRALERLFGGASLTQVQNFCNRTATGLHAGVDILRVLETESKAGSSRYRDACRDTAQRIREGYSLADSMRMQGDFFPPLLLKMVEAGEHSGQMDRTLRFMGEYYLDLKKTRQDFMSQITTPVIQLLLAIAIVCALIFINGFFRSGSMNEKPLDLTGVGLRGVSGVLIFLTIIGCIAMVLGTVAFGIWKNWFNCHNILVPLVRNVPVIGPVFTQTAMSRLSMTLSMMLGAGVDAKRSVREAILSTGNFYYMSGLPLTLQGIEKGRSLSESLAAPQVLPEEFIQAVEVGELSGNDSESLERMAIQYREKAQVALKQLAIAAGFTIWFLIAAMIVAVIFIIFTQYLSLLYGNLPK
jgi:type II secretory pathway component PulF